MFVPVGCTNCGKPFQVPETALGQSTLCPWCQSTVTALPVAEVVEPPARQPAAVTQREPPAPKWRKKATRGIPVAKSAEPKPLSLDDEPAHAPSPGRPPRPRKRFNPVPYIIVAVISLLAMVVTVAALGYGSGRVQESSWTEFTAPDGSCSVLLPAAPTEEDVEPNAEGSVTGGKRYVAKSWYTHAAAWLAWNDLNPAFAKAVSADKDRAFTASALKAELEREKARLQGTVTKEAVVQSTSSWGYEVQMDTPHGKVVEWLLVSASGPRPRLYVYGLWATNISQDSAVVRRMFTSFRIE